MRTRGWLPLRSILRFVVLAVVLGTIAIPGLDNCAGAESSVQRKLYVVAPGIRNYLEFGGAGILVFDIDDNYRFVRRIETPASRIDAPLNVKGVCAHAETGRLFFTTLTHTYCVNLADDQPVWSVRLQEGCDRLAVTPDGKYLYVPSLEKDIWYVLDAEDGKTVKEIRTNSGAHNTIAGLDGKFVYLAGLRSPFLAVADAAKHELVGKVGPFSAPVRPFTVNSSNDRCYVCINELLGFEIGDISSGKKLARIEVKDFPRGPVKRHGCPSHGIGLTPDEKQVWLCDGHNNRLHVFDVTAQPPTQVASVALREQPGWVTFRLDGAHCFSSTGEIIDTKTRDIIAALKDEEGREVHSEKMIEIHFQDDRVVRNGDQFGLGRQTGNSD